MKKEKEPKVKNPEKFPAKFNRFVDDIFSSAIDTPFDTFIRKYRFVLLIINIVMISFQIVISSITMGFAYNAGNFTPANIIAACLGSYILVMVLYIVFYIQDNRKIRNEDSNSKSMWSHYKKDILLVLRLLTTLLAIAISITLFFARTENDGLMILILVFSIINLIVNSFIFIYQIVNLIYSLTHRNKYQYKIMNRSLKQQKRRLLYIYIQNQIREYLEYSHKLDVEFKIQEDQLKKELAIEETKEINEHDDMPILAHLVDDQYEDKGIQTVREAVRAIVLNRRGKFALTKIFAKEDMFGPRDYYELPGGGVKKGETLEEALIREMEEELGLIVRVTHKLGRIDDYYNLIKQENHSYYYICEIVARTEQHLEARERGLIQKIVWVNFDKAIKLYTAMPDVLVSRLVKNRELPIIKIAKNELEVE